MKSQKYILDDGVTGKLHGVVVLKELVNQQGLCHAHTAWHQVVDSKHLKRWYSCFTCAMSCDLACSYFFSILHLQENKLRRKSLAIQLVKTQMVVMP